MLSRGNLSRTSSVCVLDENRIADIFFLQTLFLLGRVNCGINPIKSSISQIDDLIRFEADLLRIKTNYGLNKQMGFVASGIFI
jgi:hypothetical protein